MQILETGPEDSNNSFAAATPDEKDRSSLQQQLLRGQSRLMGLVPKTASQLSQLFLKPKLSINLQLSQNRFQLSPLFHELLGLFSVYKDVCWTERSHETGEQLRWVPTGKKTVLVIFRLAYTAHSLNHGLTAQEQY